MAFLANEGKMTRFGDVARVADYVVAHPPKSGKPDLVAKADDTKSESARRLKSPPFPLRSPSASPPPVRAALAPPSEPMVPAVPGATAAATASPTTSP